MLIFPTFVVYTYLTTFSVKYFLFGHGFLGSCRITPALWLGTKNTLSFQLQFHMKLV